MSLPRVVLFACSVAIVVAVQGGSPRLDDATPPAATAAAPPSPLAATTSSPSGTAGTTADILIQRAEELLRRKDVAGAIEIYRSAVNVGAHRADTRMALAFLLLQTGRSREAATHYRVAIAIEPDDPAPRNVLAWILATSPDPGIRNGTEAVREAEKATALADRANPDTLDTLAAAYAEQGDFERAVATVDECLELLDEWEEIDLAAAVRQRRQSYMARKPFRASPHATSERGPSGVETGTPPVPPDATSQPLLPSGPAR